MTHIPHNNVRTATVNSPGIGGLRGNPSPVRRFVASHDHGGTSGSVPPLDIADTFAPPDVPPIPPTGAPDGPKDVDRPEPASEEALIQEISDLFKTLCGGTFRYGDGGNSFSDYIRRELREHNGKLVVDAEFKARLIKEIYNVKFGFLLSGEYVTDKALDWVFGNGDGRLTGTDTLSLVELKNILVARNEEFEARYNSGGLTFPQFLRSDVIYERRETDPKFHQACSRLYSAGDKDFLEYAQNSIRAFLSSHRDGMDETEKVKWMKLFASVKAKADGQTTLMDESPVPSSWDGLFSGFSEEEIANIEGLMIGIYSDHFPRALRHDGFELPTRQLQGERSRRKAAYDPKVLTEALYNGMFLDYVSGRDINKPAQHDLPEKPKSDVRRKLFEWFGITYKITPEDILHAASTREDAEHKAKQDSTDYSPVPQ